jgi:hypothetical protein
MMHRTKFTMVAVALLLLISSTLAIATANYYEAKVQRDILYRQVTAAALNANGGNYGITWDVAGGGGSQMSSTSYRLHSTVGQAAIGNLSSASYEVHSGFWQLFDSLYKSFLPLILNESSGGS